MFQRSVQTICEVSSARPFLWMLVTLLVSLPAIHEVGKLGLDTNLTRLLPEQSRAVQWSRELEKSVGGGGYFSILFEGDAQDKMREVVRTTAQQISSLPQVQSVEYLYPLDFLERFAYLLLPADVLQKVFDVVVRWKAEVSPFGLKLEASKDADDGEDGEWVQDALKRYANRSEYHQSSDGQVMGMIVRPKQAVTSLGATRDLFLELEATTLESGKKAELWSGVSGSLRNKVDEYDLIMDDLQRSGTVAFIAIITTLSLSFRSLVILPVVLSPLAVGLLWSFALVPTMVGDLNTITSFLLMVLFGMGVDYSIHLVKRFQSELERAGPKAALEATFLSTGRSVATSGLTTALALLILAISDFRGFSEFGLIGGTSMIFILVAMLAVMPATLIIGHRLGLVRARRPSSTRWSLLPPAWLTALLAAVVILAAVLALGWLRFDYDFSNLKAKVPDSDEVRARHNRVYSGFSAPAAIYLVRDMDTLDRVLELLDQTRPADGEPATIGTITSIRDYVPNENQLAERQRILAELQDRLKGRWIRRVKDPDRKRWIEDLRDFVPPQRPPTPEELPPSLLRNLQARDGTGELTLAIDTAGRSRDGKMAMAFTELLYSLKMPDGVRGPTGDKPVFAEILWLVTGEGPVLIALTFLGIFLLVLIDRRSVAQTLWIILPLVTGIVLTLGVMVLWEWKLNFFNIVVLPALLGMGVDHGVHYYRRWRELCGATGEVQQELFEPLTSCTLTTMMGYAGMVFAHHPGLRSIGNLAVLGLGCCWVTALVLLPGMLRSWQRHLAKPQPIESTRLDSASHAQDLQN